MKETPTSAVSRDAGPAVKLFKQVTPRKLGIKCPSSLRNRVQSTCLDDAAHLTTYMRLWILIEVMLLFHDPWLIPQGGFTKFVYPQLAAYAFAFLVPNGWTFAAAFLARSAMYFAQMPAIWESNYWATLADLAFVVNSIAAPDRDAIRQRQYMPTVMAVLGDDLRMFLPHPFTPYTLPALELRRVLAEARAASAEPFVIEYDKLPGLVGDERWRQEAVESTVRISENGRGGRSCRIRAAGAYFWKACADDEPGLLPAPGGWLAKIRIFFPLPVHPGLDELPCID